LPFHGVRPGFGETSTSRKQKKYVLLADYIMKCMRGSKTCPPHILRKIIFMYEHIVSEITKRKRRRTRRSCASNAVP
ncbi:MAG: hypothetical protein Q7R55_00020, partial [Candidatus Wildermuthbacteria bacterium]|nr:hypothetical protein [Candidatus Wildermuthbacteria bacterium]